MKVLSIIVPAYNSQEYLDQVMQSLLVEQEQVEILIIDDGSTDNTGNLADDYERKYPTCVRAIHQKNGGHGEAVNTGILYATGRYLKVVDSDDWVDKEAYHKIINQLNQFTEEKEIDLLISNYVYEKQGAKRKKVVKYTSALPKNEVFGWKNVSFSKGQYLLMHSVIYRTQLIKDSGLRLPKHTFYVDNLFVFEPLLHVKKMYYLDVDFYRYFIGREDQSVNEEKMIAQIDQQLFVNKRMIDFYNRMEDVSFDLRNYLFNYLEIITIVSSVLLIKDNTQESLWKKEQLWYYIEENNPSLYEKMRYRFTGRVLTKHGITMRYFTINIYKMLQKLYGFN
ncbi:hypothetical protein RV11_GL001946 [Enterococcus phoeniculicola]|uniref:Glycosyltransferase 2-like domain-containing protein n=1 Tax=Enterococcus phoeniculicola ATCC BAA-412 TaxID=1158610 RepID=R3TMY5_9ENTE|nr:glycosyltransferase [Enterococcus phoeniculicola]EOL42398.1 hypothetical protein UC3_02750 [Enterococcus phoeniculicola ATCC BAA-412]EOT79323.1 hypothetical protein I589_00831 [Enterococcus phoeniculicola ATCC BAA-412]OJG73136.1 hypothetical protein RV11_GL001946 [Enterococcus phoeniculicola]